MTDEDREISLADKVLVDQGSQQAAPSDPTDQAALMGAAVAATFTLILSPGEYTLLEVVVGTTLGAVLLGYYRVPRHQFTWWDALSKASALGAVGALCLSLIVAPVLQSWLEDRGSREFCIRIQNQASDQPQRTPKYSPNDYYDCLGDQVNERLHWIWVAGVLLIGVPACMFMWKRERPKRQESQVSVDEGHSKRTGR